MFKVKHERDCDCVVAGFRWHKDGEGTAVGSLLLGLYDDAGTLQHVGVCASFTRQKRRELVEFLAPYRENALARHPWADWAERRRRRASGRMPGGKPLEPGQGSVWEPLRPELVVEVAYDHMQGDRFRHTAQFRRWRPDKPPCDCTYAQLEVVPPQELMSIFPRTQPAEGSSASPCIASSHRASPRRIVVGIGRAPARAACASGTWRRLTRMRVHVDERPRMRVDQHVVRRQ